MDALGPQIQKDRKTERLMKKQEQEEKLRLAEENSDIARRKVMGRSPMAGRKSLIQTSPRGVKKFSGVE